jgi:hypothetical protein
MSIYASSEQDKRQRMHAAVLHNTLPDGVGTWESLGANGSNVRVLTVWAAEAVRRLSGQSLQRAYFAVETAGVFACCLLLTAFLESRAGGPMALAGLLYFGSVLPLTYLFHYFHPWDKPSTAAWVLALLCAERRRWVWLGIVLIVGTLVKYDIIIFPLLLLFGAGRHASRRSDLAVAAILFLIAFSTYFALRWLFPGGAEPRHVIAMATHNLRQMVEFGPFYPPLLALGVPATLAAFGYRSSDAFARACVGLAIVLGGSLFLQTNAIEFRAELPILVLLLPAAAFGVRRLGIDSRIPAAA